MSTITVQEIEHDPLAFLRRVEAGEALLVLQGEQVLAQVNPLPQSGVSLRPYGLCADQFVVPADFDRPLPDQILAEFEGE